MTDNQIKRKIDKCDVISFDIFDTLVKRMVQNPHDIFSLVEKKYNTISPTKIIGFKENRINAEKKSRTISKQEEITLNDIYKNLSNIYTNKQLNTLKQMEINIEKDLCVTNYKIKGILEYCVEKRKTVIITSDMYLDSGTIIDILKKNNINFDKLYLSSVFNKTKHTGNLFRYIIEDLKINPHKMLHIGDNKKSDYLRPKRLGINAVHFKNKDSIIKNTNNNLTESIINSFLNNYNHSSEDLFTDIGYQFFGPLLLCFSKWLLDDLVQNNIKKIFFLSRDGFIMKKAFDLINTSNIKSNYFYASRRAIIPPSFIKYSSIEDIFSSMHIGEKIKIKSLLKKLGLDDYLKNKSLYKEYKINIEKEEKISTLITNEKYMAFFQKLYPLIHKNSKKEYDSFISYKNKNDFTGKVAIADIGWFGNMQHALEKLKLDTDICGYYMGIEPRKNYQNIQKMKGFIFESGKNMNYFLMEHNFNAIFEMLFLGQHGSVKRYNKLKEGGVEFYEYEYAESGEKDKIIKLQNSAIKFVEEFTNCGLTDYLIDESSVIFERLANLFINPTQKIAQVFGDMVFLDDEKKYIAKPKNYFHYLNAKALICDYKTSIWRIGFLKRVFRIKLPYYKINMHIRKHYLKIKG